MQTFQHFHPWAAKSWVYITCALILQLICLEICVAGDACVLAITAASCKNAPQTWKCRRFQNTSGNCNSVLVPCHQSVLCSCHWDWKVCLLTEERSEALYRECFPTQLSVSHHMHGSYRFYIHSAPLCQEGCLPELERTELIPANKKSIQLTEIW